MIFHLKGILSNIYEDFIVIEANGIGYQIFVSQNVINELPPLNENIKIFTYQHIREDQNTLYGFLSSEDKDFFLLLTSVSGVGPKAGLKILSFLKTEQMIQAILKNDLALLNQAPGVGKKTAERIIIELKDKVAKLYKLDSNIMKMQNEKSAITLNPNLQNDLMMALKTLGYSIDEVKKALKAANEKLTNDISLEQGIKILLKHL